MSNIRKTSGIITILLLILLASPAWAQSVSPTTLDFGTVTVGESADETFTVTNNYPPGLPWSASIDIESVVITDDAGSFSVDWSGSITLNPGESYTCTVTFGPDEAGGYNAEIEVTIIDGLATIYKTVTLTGWGEEEVVVEDPVVMIADLIDFYDAAVGSGELVGDGKGRFAWFKVVVIRHMLLSAQRLINYGYYDWAAWQLFSVLKHADGAPRPWDFVAGTAQPEFAGYLIDLINVLLDS